MTEENQNIETRAESPAAVTDPETLSSAVRLQVEYYFSKENLRTDTFLQSKMDAQSAVPLATVMAFPKILALTRDTQVVIKSLESSAIVALVDGKIKPKGSGRSTIILREIPSDSTEESIREIFNYPGAKPVASIRSEIGDTWFVTMESEEDAKDTIMDLKLKKRCFNSVPVKARLKTDAGLRSYYTAPTVLPIAYPGMTFQPYGMTAGGMDGQAGYGSYDSANSPSSDHTKEKSSSGGVPNGNYGSRTSKEGDDGDMSGRNSRDGKDRMNRNMKGQSNSTGPGGRGKQGPNGGKGGPRDRKDIPSVPPPPPSIEINSAADFPPLLPSGGHSASDHDHTTSMVFNSFPTTSPNQVVSNEPVVIPPRGYQTPFSRYSIDDVLHIVAGIKDATLPTSIQLAEHTAAMVTSPNTDLLLRQRTFSIDETRKQMQLGRPVQREAVITGAVDYGSLIYGEDDHSHSSGAAAGQVEGVATTGEKKAPVKAGGSWAGVLMKGGAPPPTDVKPATPMKAQPADKAAAGAAPVTASTPGGKSGDKKATGDKKAVGAKPQPESAKKDASAGTAVSKQESESKKNRRRRAGSHGGENPAKGEEDKSVAVPSSWGGRPTFANVLKQQEEAAAAEAAAAGTTPPSAGATATPAAANTKKPNPQPNNRPPPAQGGQKPDTKGPNKPSTATSPQQTNQPVTAPTKKNLDGPWVRDKLPPR